MTGRGRAGGAGTIVNAFATGHGAAFGLGFSVTATVESAAQDRVWSNGRRVPPRESRLVTETIHAIQRRLRAPEPLEVHVDSDIPPRKGLKSSSAVSVAVARAAAEHARRKTRPQLILDAAAEAGLRSRTSLTGAYDDAAACALGGVVLTDNAHRRVVRRDRLPGDLMALIHIPKESTATGTLRRADYRPLAPLVDEAWNLAMGGRYKEAMLVNTLAYAPVLGIHPRRSLRALEAGAYAAGLSGKGPAEIALVFNADLASFRRHPDWKRARVVGLERGGEST